MEFEKYLDSTNLKPDATPEDILKLCDEAKKYDFASVCVNPVYTKLVAEQLKNSTVKTCVVVGFPLGANETEVKANEAYRAINSGAEEIDMVIHVGALKAGAYEAVLNDICEVRKVTKSNVLKVIIETGLLTDDEKVTACELAVKAGADFVKTSTGFLCSGATLKDVALIKRAVGDKALIKASGGIRDYNTTSAFIEAGADRIGTSNAAKIMKEYMN